MMQNKPIKKYLNVFLIPFIITIVAIFLSFIVALIPQSAIQENAEISVTQLLAQGQWVRPISHSDPTYTLDNYTDSQILMQSYNLNTNDLSSILTNPKHVSEKDNQNMAVALDEVVNQGAENELSYSRYWMGFRIIIRPLLMLTSYFNIRKIVAFTFWTLLLTLVALMSKKKKLLSIIAFAASIALMNPAIVSQSLQFSCCFILAFLFVGIIVLSDLDKINSSILFCLFGSLTMLFDFYTTPLITFGLPIVTLLTFDEVTNHRWSLLLKTFFSWVYGYASMWLIKLVSVSLFTDESGISDGFKSFFGRVGITVTEGLEDKYDAVKALRLVCENVFPGTIGKLFLALFVVTTVAAIIYSVIKNDRKVWMSSLVLLAVAALPIIWFMCTAQPTVIHYWFQYRTVVVTFVALFEFYIISFQNIKDTKWFLKLRGCIKN